MFVDREDTSLLLPIHTVVPSVAVSECCRLAAASNKFGISCFFDALALMQTSCRSTQKYRFGSVSGSPVRFKNREKDSFHFSMGIVSFVDMRGSRSRT